MGSFVHACEGEMVCESVNPKIPYFNAPIYLENKTAIGKVDEILGPINQVYFTIKPQEGIVATSFKSGDKFYIGGDKLLPLDRSGNRIPAQAEASARLQIDVATGTAKPKRAGGSSRGAPMRGGRGGGRGRGAPRGRGFAGDRGGRGARGGGRGGFSSRGGGGRGGNPNFTRPTGFRGRGS
ncbi:MAG: hypothetical protein Q9202_000091 [Teloschistes flavicans]